MRDSHDGEARTRDCCYSGSNGRERTSGHLHAVVEKWASEEDQAAVSEGVIEEKSTVKALISDAHFNLPSLVHNPGIFFYLQVWHPTVSEPSEHHVLSTFGIQDTLSCKVKFVYFFDCSSQLLLD